MAKGKIVKQWAASLAAPDGQMKLIKIPICLTTGDGYFHIDIAPHICEFFGTRSETGIAAFNPREREVAAKTMDAACAAFNQVQKLYTEKMQDLNKRKVILVTYQAKRSIKTFLPSGAGQIEVGTDMDHIIAEISFCEGPALALKFDVLWEVNGSLYQIRRPHHEGDAETMYWVADTPDPNVKGRRSQFLLEWTEERETFFRNARDNMNRLISMIARMLLGDTERNIDTLIAGGGGLLALPAPTQENEDA